MAIALVQQSNNGAATVTNGATVAYPTNVGSGVLLCAGITIASGTVTVSSITDTLGNTWALAGTAALTNSNLRAEIWWAFCPTGGANILTFNWTAAGNGQVNMQEWSGFPDGVTLGPTNSNAFAGTTGHAGEITTTAAESVIVAVYRCGSAFLVTGREAGYTALTTTSRADFSYLISGAITTDADVTFDAAEAGPACIAAFAATEGGGGGAKPWLYRSHTHTIVAGLHGGVFVGLSATLTHLLGTGGVTDAAFVYRGRTDRAATIKIEYSPNSDLSGSTISAGVSVVSGDDFTGGETISGLSAATVYYYSLLVNDVRVHAAPFPRTKTFPTEGVDASVKILVSSCQKRHTDAVTGCWIPAAAENPDVHVQLGDFVYGDHHELETLRPAYQQEYTGDQQTYITRVMPRAQTKDDHDSGANNANGSTPGIALTRQVWREYVPSYPLWDGTKHIGYDFKLANCHFFVVDTREQRESSRPRYPDTGQHTFTLTQAGSSGSTVVLPSDASSGTGYPGWYMKVITSSGTYFRRVVSYVGATRTATVDRAIPDLAAGDDVAVKRASFLDKGNLGAGNQVDRLCDGIINTTARWKFFCTSVLWNRRWLTPSGTSDSWAGWETEYLERSYILERIQDANVKNLIVLSGDGHFSAIDDGLPYDDWPLDFPELASSSFHRVPVNPNGLWSHGTYNATPSYAIVDVDGTGHTVTLTVKKNDGTVAPSVTPLVLAYAA